MDDWFPDPDSAYEDRFELDHPEDFDSYDSTDWDQLEDDYYEFEDYHNDGDRQVEHELYVNGWR